MSDFIPERRQSVVRKDSTGSSMSSEAAAEELNEPADEVSSSAALESQAQAQAQAQQVLAQAAREDAALKRSYVLQEFISSEETYYNRLQITMDQYVKPLRQLEILSAAEINSQFYSWDLLVGLHKDLWENMVRDHDAGTLNVGARFKLFSHFLKCYSQYLANFDRARVERARLLTTNKKFANFVERVQNSPESQHLPLESFLAEPVQRVPRYRLLLEQLLKYTPEGHAERAATAEALALTAEVAQANNDAIVLRAQKDKIMAIMMSLSSATRVNLLDDPSRELLKEATLQRQCRRGIKEFHFWLFSDRLLYGEQVSAGLAGPAYYSLNRDISLTACRVRPVKPTEFRAADLGADPDANAEAVPDPDPDPDPDHDPDPDAEPDADADAEDATNTSLDTFSVSSKHSSLGSLGPDSFSSKSSSKSTRAYRRKSSLNAVKETIFSLHQPPAGKDAPLTEARAFIVESPQKSFQVWASSEGEKLAWVAAIDGAIAALRRKIGEAGEDIAPLWIPDTAVAHCQRCETKFGLVTRRHHCRNCGCNVCDTCSLNRCTLSHVDSTKDVRVCNACFLSLASRHEAAAGGPEASEGKSREWTPDHARSTCFKCECEFGLLNRRHHCRSCGALCCAPCSSKRSVLRHVDPSREVRVCDVCWGNIKLGARPAGAPAEEKAEQETT